MPSRGPFQLGYSGIIIGPGIKMPIQRSFIASVSKYLVGIAEE